MATDTLGASRRAREGQHDVLDSSNDPEQQRVFAEIVELLLSAGYFRARISGMSPFDKVVGGLAWAITASNTDVEVDIFFQEEARLGVKIELGEKIIKALIKMKCPFPLQTQQIQGLDFINIFPVIQWLVKKVYETRLETGDLIRQYSEFQFHKFGRLPQDTETESRKKDATAYVKEVVNRYKPTRKFKRPGDLEPRTEDDRVQYTLLEYGKLFKTSAQVSADMAKSKKSKPEEEEKARKAAELEEKKKDEMFARLNSAGDAARVAGATVMGYVGMQKGEIAAAVGQYGEGLQFSASENAAERRSRLEKDHQRHKEQRQRALGERKVESEKLRAAYAIVAAKLKEAQDAHGKRKKLNLRITKEIEKLLALETPENAPVIRKLRHLVHHSESMKSQEALFRSSCRKQKEQFEGLIAKLQQSGPTSEDSEKEKALDEQLAELTLRLSELRQQAAHKTRQLALVQRKIDDMPSRSELQQYQRAFSELYEQVAARLTETRQYYATYNTLEDTKTYLGREVSILTSVQDNYKAALSSPDNRTKFLGSLDTISAAVNTSLDKVNTKMGDEKKGRDAINDKYLALVEKERAYYKAAKEFQDECKKNELLNEKLGVTMEPAASSDA